MTNSLRLGKPQNKMIDRTTKYAKDVLSGKIIACKNVKLACKRHIDDMTNGGKRGLYFDIEAANRVLNFFSYLSLSEGEFAGQSFVLQPFQCFIVGSLFGWKGADNYRRFRKAYIEIAKGNGKSPLAAGIGLYGLLASKEEGAEIYAAAVTRDQANILFTDAKRMIEASEKLSKRVMINVRNLAVLETNSYFRPLSSEARSLDGKRVFMALIDEIHEHPNALVVDKMQAGTKGRREPLIFEITNSGYDKESVCWHHHVYSEQILKGSIEDDGWFSYISGIDEGDDWKDEKTWIKANPNLGVSVTMKYLREQVKEAIGMPSKENIVKRLNFCIWTQQSTRWINTDVWNKNNTKEIDEASLIGKKCYGGLDLSSVSDITAWVMVFPDDDDPEKVDILARFWCPEKRLRDESNRYKDQYQVWARQGYITTTPGNAVDYGFVKAQILEDAQKFQLVDMNIDRLFQGHQIAMELIDEGVVVTGMGMGYISFAAPMKEFERRLLARKLNHGGNPVLRWMADNVAVSQDPAGNLKPNKAESQGKIDGIVSLIMALDRASRNVNTGSVYEERGLLVI